MSGIVKDMLLFAHLPQPRLNPVDLAQLIGSTADATDKDPNLQNVRMEVIGTVPSTLGDAELLRIVFSNLFTNSAQAMRGTGTIQVSPVYAVLHHQGARIWPWPRHRETDRRSA